MGGKLGSVLVFAGTVMSAFAKWYLVWLFARLAGGADAVGEYSRILAFATPVFVLCQLGLRTIYVSSRTSYSWRAYRALRIIGIAAAVMVVLIYLWIDPQISLGLGLAILFLKVNDSLLDLYQGRVQHSGRMTLLGSTMLGNALLTILVSTLVVLATGRVEAGVVSAGLVSTAVAAWARYVSKSTGEIQGIFAYRELLKQSAPVTTSQFLASLLFQIPILLLGWYAEDAVVGVFAGAAYLLTVANLIGSTIQTVLITPLRARLQASGVRSLRAPVYGLLMRVGCFGAAGGTVVIFAGSNVLELVYGPGFGVGRWPLALISAAAVLTIMAYVLSVTLNVLNEYGTVTISMALSCVTSGTLGPVVITKMDPINGAALIVAVAAVIRLLSMWIFVGRKLRLHG